MSGRVLPTDRAAAYAESAAKVWDLTRAEQMAGVERGTRTMPQALAVCRRKHDALRAEYFARPSWEATEEAWQEHGPARAWDALVRNWNPSTAGKSAE